MARGHWVRRDRGGQVVVRLEPLEAETLVAVVAELRAVLEAGAGNDPVSRRLFPRAYLDPTEEEAEEQWQSLVQPDLLRTRLDALAAMTASLTTADPTRRGNLEIVLDDASQAQWLGVLNDARLALGTSLDITEETELDHFETDDPQRGRFLLYSALTALEGELVDALLSDV
ncbi:MAG: hypothetical protein QOH10_2818 [Actinomycetota bacterium]|jgi:hypothetical protein|nr:hypothetical protein [Actinomycetota bacterium]